MTGTLRLLSKAIQQQVVLWRDTEKILQLQRKRLRKMVAWAKAKSPYYAERLSAIDPDHFELRELPILTKTEMLDGTPQEQAAKLVDRLIEEKVL